MCGMSLRVKPFLLALLLAAAALAQSTVAVSLNFTGSGTVGTDFAGTGTGTMTPFGQANVVIVGTQPQQGTSMGNFQFDFGSLGTLAAATTSVQQNGTNAAGTASFVSGTGGFQGASGSISFTVTPSGDVGPVSFTFTGTGTLTTPNPVGTGTGTPQVCQPGSGSSLPSSCSIIICSEGSGSTLPILRRADGQPDATTPASGGSCSIVNPNGATGAGGAVFVFDGACTIADGCQGAGGAVFVFDGGGGSGGSVLVLDGGGAGGSVLLLAGESSGAGGAVDRPCRRCATTTTTPSGNPIELLTPLQSVAATYTAAVQCADPSISCWISVPTASGNIAAGTRAAITAFVTTQALPPGVSSATVSLTITPAGQPATTLTISITLVIPATGPTLSLPETGLTFQSGGSAGPAAQSIPVINTGSGSLSFSTKTTATWLSVSPASGSVNANASQPVSIQANPAGLAPGTHQARIDFAASHLANATQSVEVSFTVLPATSITPQLSTTGLIFVTGAASPAAQTVKVSSPNAQPLTISTKLSFATGTNWFTVVNNQGTLTVNANPAGLARGIYAGTLDVHVQENNSDTPVEILLIVKPAGTCTATQLLPVFTNLEGAFQRQAGRPIPLQAQVVDDCGVPLTSGSVAAYFANGDPSAPLVSLGQGQWAGTWMPHTLAGGKSWAGLAATGATGLFGSSGVIGTLTANSSAPVLTPGGIVSAASLAAPPLSPGGFVSLFGSNLAAAVVTAPPPYPTTLGATQVTLGGESVPLQVASNGQINVVIPADAIVGAPQQFIVETNGVDSLPETVVIAPAQPAVFTVNQSGKGAGVVVVVRTDGTQFINTPSTPAAAGDALVIYCTGLGAATQPVTVTLGTQTVQPFYAGPTAGYPGLYQVNVFVPPGIVPSSAVPLILTSAGASSPPVTVALK